MTNRNRSFLSALRKGVAVGLCCTSISFVVAQDALCRARRACTFERSCAPAFNLAENSVTSGGDGLSIPRARIRPLGDAAWLRKY